MTIHQMIERLSVCTTGNQCLLPHFLTTLGAKEKTDCINVVINWPGYLPTSITWPYRGLRCRPTKVEYFFEVIRWQVASFEMIAGSSLFFKNSYERCCVYVTMGPALFCFQTNLGRENSASYFKIQAGQTFSYQGHVLVTLYIWFSSDWSKFDRWVHVENLRSILKLAYFDSWSWQSFVSTF